MNVSGDGVFRGSHKGLWRKQVAATHPTTPTGPASLFMIQRSLITHWGPLTGADNTPRWMCFTYKLCWKPFVRTYPCFLVCLFCVCLHKGRLACRMYYIILYNTSTCEHSCSVLPLYSVTVLGICVFISRWKFCLLNKFSPMLPLYRAMLPMLTIYSFK